MNTLTKVMSGDLIISQARLYNVNFSFSQLQVTIRI